ncbi:MAG: hypothetical protein KW793_01125 [Candidatus Doudnabacteria bacterium]|nr:hypothetical protein [Candidatus Doudnabacteria bacterium]
MKLSQKARKALATGLALSTLVWSAALVVVPVASAAPHSNGCLVNSNGTVFALENGQRRGFPSPDVLLSHGNTFGQVVMANADDMALPVGPVMVYAEGSIIKGPNDPLVYLVSGGQKRGFVSGSVFTGLGYSFANIQWAPVNTFQDLPTGSNVESATERHPNGTWVIDGTGTVWRMTATGRMGLPSMEVFNSYGKSWATVVVANAADMAASNQGVVPLRAGCTGGGTTPTPGTDCGNLSGNAGDITISQTSDFGAEEVGEGEEEIGVLSFEVEADDESDVEVTSVKVELKQTDTDVSQDLEDYMSEVQVMMGDNVVGTADVDDFNETSNIFTKTISLDCAVIRADETEQFSISVSAVDQLDSTDIADENFEVELQNVRFEDADGVTTTESVSTDSIDETFDFVDFATAADVELSVSLTDGEEDINESHNIVVDEDEATDDVAILAFSLEAEGDSDIWVDEIPVLLTSSDSDVDTVVTSADLYHGTTLIDSKNVSSSSTTASVTFDDLDMTIDAGDTEDFVVKVNVKAADSSNYAEGATLKAELTSTQVDAIDAEDEEGDDVTTTDLTGSALGEAHSFFSNGISVEVNSADSDVTSNDGAGDDSVAFTWDITITNNGDDDVYINSDVADIVSSSSGTDVDIVYTVEDGSATLGSFSGTITDDTSATEVTGASGDFSGETFFKISSGSSEDFTITLTATNTSGSAQARAMLSDIEWTTDVDGGVEQSYTATLADDSRTSYKLVN